MSTPLRAIAGRPHAMSRLVPALGLWLWACGGSSSAERPGGTLHFEPTRPQRSEAPAPLPYAGANPVVLEAMAQQRTALALHRNVIARTCGPTSGVCHNQKEYPDLHTPENLLGAVNAPCNVQAGDWSNVYDGCELVGDRLRLSGAKEGQEVEIGYVDFIAGASEEYDASRPPTETSPGLHIAVDQPVVLAEDGRIQRWLEGQFVRTLEEPSGEVREVSYASYRSSFWLLDEGRHLFAEVADWQARRVDELLAGGVVQGDLNRNGKYGARSGERFAVLAAGAPERSYLIGRLRGALAGDTIPGTRMPLANQPLSLPEMLALYCFVEGLPPGGLDDYDLTQPIDYAGCSWAENPEELNLLGEGVTWLGRVKPVLESSCGGCHGGANPAAGFDVLAEGLYGRLLEAREQGLPLVTAGDSEQSYLWRKLTGAAGIVGQQMPLNAQGQPNPLSAGVLGDIQVWIERGALREE